MPVMSGFDAAREIAKILPEIPILMLSMHESKQIIEEAQKIGVKGYVTKTQVGAVLLHAVDALLSKETFYPALP
jgi:DNA-binding NarL/FixJ family response regulator